MLYITDSLQKIFMNQTCSPFWIQKFCIRISQLGRSASVTSQLHTLPTAIRSNGGRNMPYLYNGYPKRLAFGTLHQICLIINICKPEQKYFINAICTKCHFQILFIPKISIFNLIHGLGTTGCRIYMIFCFLYFNPKNN